MEENSIWALVYRRSYGEDIIISFFSTKEKASDYKKQYLKKYKRECKGGSLLIVEHYLDPVFGGNYGL